MLEPVPGTAVPSLTVGQKTSEHSQRFRKAKEKSEIQKTAKK